VLAQLHDDSAAAGPASLPEGALTQYHQAEQLLAHGRDRAIAQGGSSWALYLRGVIEQDTGRQGATAAAIARFRAAIERDPDLAQAWRDLGRALERTKATSALDQLRRDYQARFTTRLPS